MKAWYSAGLALTQELAVSSSDAASGVRKTFADKLRGLWTKGGMYDEVERVSLAISKFGFWREGWIAVRKTLSLDGKDMTPDVKARLEPLEKTLRPKDLVASPDESLLRAREGNRMRLGSSTSALRLDLAMIYDAHDPGCCSLGMAASALLMLG